MKQQASPVESLISDGQAALSATDNGLFAAEESDVQVPAKYEDEDLPF